MFYICALNIGKCFKVVHCLHANEERIGELAVRCYMLSSVYLFSLAVLKVFIFHRRNTVQRHFATILRTFYDLIIWSNNLICALCDTLALVYWPVVFIHRHHQSKQIWDKKSCYVLQQGQQFLCGKKITVWDARHSSYSYFKWRAVNKLPTPQCCHDKSERYELVHLPNNIS